MFNQYSHKQGEVYNVNPPTTEQMNKQNDISKKLTFWDVKRGVVSNFNFWAYSNGTNERWDKLAPTTTATATTTSRGATKWSWSPDAAPRSLLRSGPEGDFSFPAHVQRQKRVSPYDPGRNSFIQENKLPLVNFMPPKLNSKLPFSKLKSLNLSEGRLSLV